MGETLGRYTLQRRIGVGGMAEVFLAREALEGGGERLCVVKRAHPFLASDFSALRMFLDEAQLVAQLRHPNIVQIFDLGSINGAFFIAMEYVPGFDLLTIVQEHERQAELIPEPVAARMVAQAAAALDHAHKAVGQDGRPLEIIHRDVSPQNILLSTAGEVKLIDFGVAKASIAKHATQLGIVKGKYAYMSPEQIAGKPVDCRTDIYALGLVFYELLTNTRAIAGESEPQIVENAGRGRVAPIESLRPNLSEGLRQILARCLSPSREGRYASAAELSAELERHLAAGRQRVGPAECARLLAMVGSDPEVSLEEPEPVAGPRADLGVSGIGDTAIRASASHARPTELALPQSDPGLPRAPRTEPLLEGVTQQATPAVKGAARPPAAAAAAAQPVTAVELPRGSRSRWGLWAAAGAVLVAAGVGGAVLHFRAPAAPREGFTAEELLAADRELAAKAEPAPPGASAEAPEAGAGPESAERVPGKPAVAAAGAEAGGPGPGEAADPGAGSGEAANPGAGAERPGPPETPTAPDKPAAPRAPARLTVTSSPSTEVFVDGKKRGRTPLELTVAAGAHRVELKDAAAGLRRTVKLKLAAGQRHTESWSPQKGTLTIEVVPFGDISVDGKSLGVVSFKSVEVWEGTHAVRVVNDELKRTEERKVQVAPGAESKTVIRLQE